MKIYNSKFVLASIISVIVAILLLLSFQMYYATNDDYIMSILIQNGDIHSFFLNIIMTAVTFVLQKILPFVNTFVLFQVINCVVSVIIINYILLSKYKNKLGLFIVLAFDSFALFIGIISIQWTHTTVLMCSSGLALVYYALFEESRKKTRILQTIIGLAVTVWGSLYRFTAYEVVLVFFCALCGCLFIETIAKNKEQTKSFRVAFSNGVKKYTKTVLCLILLLVLSFGCHFLSDVINNHTKNYATHVDFNSARSMVADYDVAPFKGNEESYSEFGIYSEEDITLVKKFIFDADYLNTDRLNAIADFSKQHGYQENGISFLCKKALDKIARIFPSSIIQIVIIGIGLVFIGAVVLLLFYLSNHIKILFPLVLAGIWIVFFSIYSINETSFLGAIAAIIVVFSCFFHNRYHYLICFIFSLISIVLFIYQYYLRISFRVTFTFFMPMIVFILVSYDNKREKKRYRFGLVSNKLVWKNVAVLLLFVTTLISSYFITIQNITIGKNSLSIPSTKKYYDTVTSFIKNNSDMLYVYNTQLYTTIDKGCVYPLCLSNYPENTLLIGDWQVASDYYENKLKDTDVKEVFKEMVNSENKCFIIETGSRELLETYYNNHYSKDGETISLKRISEDVLSSNIGVYQVVSQ